MVPLVVWGDSFARLRCIRTPEPFRRCFSNQSLTRSDGLVKSVLVDDGDGRRLGNWVAAVSSLFGLAREAATAARYRAGRETRIGGTRGPADEAKQGSNLAWFFESQLHSSPIAQDIQKRHVPVSNHSPVHRVLSVFLAAGVAENQAVSAIEDLMLWCWWIACHTATCQRFLKRELFHRAKRLARDGIQ